MISCHTFQLVSSPLSGGNLTEHILEVGTSSCHVSAMAHTKQVNLFPSPLIVVHVHRITQLVCVWVYSVWINWHHLCQNSGVIWITISTYKVYTHGESTSPFNLLSTVKVKLGHRTLLVVYNVQVDQSRGKKIKDLETVERLRAIHQINK